jgi:hypothetical protein
MPDLRWYDLRYIQREVVARARATKHDAELLGANIFLGERGMSRSTKGCSNMLSESRFGNPTTLISQKLHLYIQIAVL